MAKPSKTSGQAQDLIAVWARLDPEDHAELRRREEMTGAPLSAQIRIIVRNALRGKKAVVR